MAGVVGSEPPGSLPTHRISSTDPAGGVDYAVSIKGLIRDHGWTYDGGLSGIRHTTESFTENLSIIGPFDVTADPAGVTGMCDTYSTVGEYASSDAPVDTTIYCVLSKDGSTPWLTVIDSEVWTLSMSLVTRLSTSPRRRESK